MVRDARCVVAGVARPFAGLSGRKVHSLRRRAKSMLFDFDDGSLIVHLGMSGRLRVLKSIAKPGRTTSGSRSSATTLLRCATPGSSVPCYGRREMLAASAARAPGVEPLEDGSAVTIFTVQAARRTVRSATVMNHTIVFGVGNIYASESLFRAHINPRTAASRLSRARCEALVSAVKETLEDALRAGGSTLRDFVGSDGAAGHFQLQTFVYDRAGDPCRACTQPIRWLRQGQRSTYFCPSCQK